MEYPSPNLAEDKTQQGYYYSPVVGTYDDWVIRYGYSEFKKAKTPEDEKKYLAEIAAECADPLKYYGADENYYMVGSVDAFTNTYDLGGDPLAWAKERGAYITALYNGLDKKMVGEGESWNDFTTSFGILLWNYYRSLNYISRYVAGMSTSRSHRGDPEGTDPMIMLNPEKQREPLEPLGPEPYAGG
jgi:hypothetical protein